MFIHSETSFRYSPCWLPSSYFCITESLLWTLSKRKSHRTIFLWLIQWGEGKAKGHRCSRRTGSICMANVTRALLQPLGTHTKPHKARLALGCAPLPKEELYVTSSQLQAQKKPEGEQPQTGFCQRRDLLSGFKPDKALPWFLSRHEVQFLFPNSKCTHHPPWKAKGAECCFTVLDPMHCWPAGRTILHTMTPMSAHDTINWDP